jgi:hypothetical protein
MNVGACDVTVGGVGRRLATCSIFPTQLPFFRSRFAWRNYLLPPSSLLDIFSYGTVRLAADQLIYLCNYTLNYTTDFSMYFGCIFYIELVANHIEYIVN